MKLNSSSVSFGRHESFPLRYGWLTKGLTALLDDSKVFEQEDATVTLGVGKNMVASIRYWLQASQIVRRNKENVLGLTPVGKIVASFNGRESLSNECGGQTGFIWSHRAFVRMN